tara:strand:- start:1018 stop:1206 length:189 start_codon:yes stop_codon:yes gene_type:complete
VLSRKGENSTRALPPIEALKQKHTSGQENPSGFLRSVFVSASGRAAVPSLGYKNLPFWTALK